MAKSKPNQKRRQRPGTSVIQHAAAVRQAAAQPPLHAPPDHDSVAGELKHSGRELLSMVIALVELGAIFAVSWAAGQYAEYLQAHHMPAWKVAVFEGIDDLVMIIDVILFAVYFGNKAILKLKKEFR